jgi:hypothetical protein
VTKTFPDKSFKFKYFLPALSTVIVVPCTMPCGPMSVVVTFDPNNILTAITASGHLAIHRYSQRIHSLIIVFWRIVWNNHSISNYNTRCIDVAGVQTNIDISNINLQCIPHRMARIHGQGLVFIHFR